MRFVGGKGQVGDPNPSCTMAREVEEEVGLKVSPAYIRELDSYTNTLGEPVYTGVIDIGLDLARQAAARVRGSDIPALVSYDEIKSGAYGNVPIHQHCRSIFLDFVLPRPSSSPALIVA